MSKKFYSLRVKIIILFSALSIAILASVLLISQYIFKKYYINTYQNYLYDLCVSTASSLNVNASDGISKSNVKVKYVLQNINVEGVDSLEVGLLDSNGKYIYYSDESQNGRYVTDNDIIEEIVINMRNKKIFNAAVKDGEVNGVKKVIAFSKTIDGQLLFLQVDKSEMSKPVYKMIVYCLALGLVILIGMIFFAMIFVDRIYKSEKRIQNELKEAKERAEQANAAKSEFLANMSHEIRTPINAMLGMNEMIIRENRNAVIADYANTIKNAGNTLLSLVNDILDFTKVSSGKLNLVETEFDTASLFNDLVNMFGIKASAKGLQLKVNIDTTMPCRLYGDEVRIKQILINLLSNAVKYTNEGFIQLSVKILGTSNGNVSYRVSVQDTGIGIRKEEFARLFESFGRLDERKNKSIEGTGLGMPITKNLLKLMESDLNVVSEYGKGSIFSFILKQKIIDNKPIGDIVKMRQENLEQKRYIQRFIAPNAEILIVDDVEMNLNVSIGLLKTLQMKMDTANGAKNAIDKCRQKQYDLIFMDYMMPEIDGIEATQMIREQFENYKNIPIIALTADAVVGAKTKFANAGMQDYVTKPINVEKIENTLLRWLPKEKIQMISEEDMQKMVEEENHKYDINLTELSKNENKQEVLNLPIIDGIDSMKAVNLLGTVQLFIDSLKMYHDSIDKKSSLIEQYEKEEKFEDYEIQVHALKSMSKSIAAGQVGDLAEYLENCAKNKNYSEIHEKTPALLQVYREFKDKLAPYSISKFNEDENDNDIGINNLKLKLDELADYINSYNIDKAEEWLESINQNDFDRYVELNEIKHNIEDIKFAECKVAINKLLSNLDN